MWLVALLPVLPRFWSPACTGAKLSQAWSLSPLPQVSGELWALDDKTLKVKNFNYDGAGPDAFFWVGTHIRHWEKQSFIVLDFLPTMKI